MSRAVGLVLAFALLGARPASAGPALAIYRCVAADGSVTLQNGVKCPKGTREQKRWVQTPTSVGAPAPPVARPAAASSSPAPVAGPRVADAPTAIDAAAAEAPRLPPPVLYTCLTADAQRYYSDAGNSARCAPVATVGLDRASEASGQACEVVEDRCEPVPEAERCAAWAERRRTAEQALTFSPEQFEAARDELARVDAAVAGTACGR